MFRVLNVFLMGCAFTASLIAADNAAPPSKTPPLLTDYRLTWDINSAAWGWNIDSTVDIEEVRKFTSSIASVESNEAGYAGRVKISAEAGGEAKGGLAIIGIPHLSISGSAKMGFDKDKSSFLNNTSRTELKNIAEAVSLYSKRVHLSKMHLSFTVTFFNLTDEDVTLICKSVPVRCGGEHFVDATPVQGREAITIPGGRGEGIDVMFRAELDTTKAISLINAMQENSLEINILRGQIKGLTKDGTDLISETSKKSAQTNCLDICIAGSNKSILSWRVFTGSESGAKTPLKTILEVINQTQTDENGATLFKIDGGKLSGVGILPIVGDKVMLLAISGNKTELLSDLDISKPMREDLTILCCILTDYSSKQYITSSVVAGLSKLAKNNNQNAQVKLGDCYLQGVGVANDEIEAVKWYRKAAEQGNAMGQASLGSCYIYGFGVAKDEAETIKWVRKAAEQGNAEGQGLLGLCYFQGFGVTKDDAEAVKWYRKAAEQGNAIGQGLLGLCYLQGFGVAKDEAEGVEWYQKAARQGNASSQAMLGFCYANGIGVAKNYTESVKWYRKAAEQGVADVQCSLGLSYLKGEGVTKDPVKAVELFRKAAEQGVASAQFFLGYSYFNGEGVTKDRTKAAEWYRKAAEQGNANAQAALGDLYIYGLGVDKDDAEAVKWYRKAAEQGNKFAQEALKLLGK